jgi:hypothetical protein
MAPRSIGDDRVRSTAVSDKYPACMLALPNLHGEEEVLILILVVVDSCFAWRTQKSSLQLSLANPKKRLGASRLAALTGHHSKLAGISERYSWNGRLYVEEKRCAFYM